MRQRDPQVPALGQHERLRAVLLLLERRFAADELEALGQLASMPWLRDHGPHVLEPLWQGAEWLSDHLELLGIGAVGAFLMATVVVVMLAPRIVARGSSFFATHFAKV